MQWSAKTNLRKWQILSWDGESPGQQMNPDPPNYKMIPSFSTTVLIPEIWLHYCNNQWKTPPQWCQSLKLSCKSATGLHEIAAQSRAPQAAPNQKINHPILKHSKSYCRELKQYMILGKWPAWRTILFYVFISILYMFRATSCSSSGESIVSIQTLVYVTLCRWPFRVQVRKDLHTKRSPIQSDIYQRLYWYNWFSYDEHEVAQNM
jgi:hypothetical protein